MRRFRVFIVVAVAAYLMFLIAFLVVVGGAVSCQDDCPWIARQDWTIYVVVALAVALGLYAASRTEPR